jgi:hypothetical protein
VNQIDLQRRTRLEMQSKFSGSLETNKGNFSRVACTSEEKMSVLSLGETKMIKEKIIYYFPVLCADGERQISEVSVFERPCEVREKGSHWINSSRRNHAQLY